MRYFTIEPEVAGHLGEATLLDRSTHPPVIHRLHYEFDDWLGDDIVEAFPAYLVTNRLRQLLENECITNIQFRNCVCTVSPQYKEWNEGSPLPEFWWLQLCGSGGSDDIGLVPPARLVVSEKVLRLFRTTRIPHADVKEWVG